MRSLKFEEMSEVLGLPKSVIDKLVATGKSEEEVMAEALCDANGNSTTRKKRKFVQACLEKGYIYIASPKERAIRNIAASANREHAPFDKNYYYVDGNFIKEHFLELAPIAEDHCDYLIEELKNHLTEREYEAVMRRECLLGNDPTMKGVSTAMGISVPTLHHILAKAIRKLMRPSGMKLVDLMCSDYELFCDSQAMMCERAKLEQEPTVRRYLEILKIIEYRKEHLGERATGPVELIEDLDLTVRSYNCLRRAGFTTVQQLLLIDMARLKKIRNLGRGGAEEIIKKLGELGYALEAGEEENETE